MMEYFFVVVGVLATIFIAGCFLIVLYMMFITPFFQAISIMRWLTACMLATANKRPNLKERWAFFKWGYEVGGVRTTRYSNNIGEWCGIGRWQVFKPE